MGEKCYKGFEKGLVCRGKQYKENTVFEEENAEICKSGMHYCKNPFDVLDYYNLLDDNGNFNDFAEVEPLGEELTDDNKKFCTKKLKIGAKLSLKEFINASLEVTRKTIEKEAKEKTKNTTGKSGDWARLAGGNCATLAGGDSATLAGGDSARLAGGDSATLAGGDSATLAGGDSARLAGGDSATLAGGDSARLAGGDSATLAGGYRARLAGGDSARLAGGNWATLAGGDSARLAGGDSATLAGGNWATLAGGNWATLAGGEYSICFGDNGSIAKAKKGSLIVLVERKKDGSGVIKDYFAGIVDGIEIKEDVFYKLENGKLVEVEDE